MAAWQLPSAYSLWDYGMAFLKASISPSESSNRTIGCLKGNGQPIVDEFHHGRCLSLLTDQKRKIISSSALHLLFASTINS